MRDPSVAAEAQSTAIRIARAIAPHRPAEARDALEAVLRSSPAETQRKRARSAQDEIKRCEGFLTAWEVSPAYGKEGIEGDALLAMPFDPETNPAKTTWTPLPRDEESDEPCQMDIKQLHDEDRKAGYLRTTLVVPKQGTYRLEVGSDDGVKVWLDGKVVHVNMAWRGVVCGDDAIPVKLTAGRHDLMVKVVNGEGGWGACVSLKTASGSPVPGATSEIPLP
jgi:hypothetical protein